MVGFGAALAGDQVFYLALTWTAAQVLPPGQVGLLLVAAALPRAIVLLFGGVAVDRIGPKRIIIVSDSARTMIMIAAALLLIVTGPQPLLLVVLAVAFGVVDGFFLPAVGAVPAFVAAPESMAKLQAVRSLVYRGAPVVGAAIGGWLIARGTASAPFVLNVGLFALSVAALTVTRMVQPAGLTAGVSTTSSSEYGESAARRGDDQTGLAQPDKQSGSAKPSESGLPLRLRSALAGLCGKDRTGCGRLRPTHF